MKVFWVTDMNTEETYVPNFEALCSHLADSLSVSLEEAAETLHNLGENETLQFTHQGKLIEVDIETVTEVEK